MILTRMIAPVVLAAALASCRDGTAPGRALGAEEAEALAAAATANGMTAIPAMFEAANPATFSLTYNDSVACVPSGTVTLAGAISGSFDGGAQSASLQVNAAVTHHACMILTDAGQTFVITGDPRIDLALAAAADPSGLTALRFTEVGAFRWARGDASGRCSVNVTAALAPGRQTVTLRGSFCGFPVDVSVPVSEETRAAAADRAAGKP